LIVLFSSRQGVAKIRTWRKELDTLGKKVDIKWISKSCRRIDALHARLRRNINRSLGMDAVAISLARPGRIQEFRLAIYRNHLAQLRIIVVSRFFVILHVNLRRVLP